MTHFCLGEAKVQVRRESISRHLKDCGCNLAFSLLAVPPPCSSIGIMEDIGNMMREHSKIY